uniref:Calpain-10 isoform X8 n=1 Tax=Callorhinus ursinus TaxID=34884 RepID=A0A3Q7QQF4_CALUR|nr:calpain-10 isoform X8 [Callorhinus ursinus]
MLVSLEMASLLSKTSQERPSLACKYTVSMETSAWSPVLGAPWLWPQRCLGSTESASLAWKEEICATPRLFADNPQEGQVKQGLLGDCWFLCACAALQKSRHLLDQVFPPGQPSWHDHTYRGSFTCRVWQFGRWVEVTIDDRLPCLAGRLCFSRCQREDVFWLPLLEKVYAKVYGSYEHLWAGQVADALVDLTGGLAERWSLRDLARASSQQDRPGGSEHRTCRRLLSLKDRCLISCSVLSPRAGARELGEFHAFIVSDLRELQGRAGQSILLLCIQNPWGRRCWQGPWREGGEGWSRVDPADESELLSQLQEGEFWVEEEEFLQEFDEVTVGFPITEAGHLQSLYSGKALCHTQELPGAWVKGQSAGGCRNNSGFPSNPKFWLRVSEPSEVFAAVLQRPRVCAAGQAGRARAPVGDRLASRSPASFLGEDYQAVGLHIWKVEKRRVSLPRVLSTPPVAGTVCHAYDREVHLRCELTPGYYLAVPSTFLKDVPAQFLLRVFSSGRVSLSAGPERATSRPPVCLSRAVPSSRRLGALPLGRPCPRASGRPCSCGAPGEPARQQGAVGTLPPTRATPASPCRSLRAQAPAASVSPCVNTARTPSATLSASTSSRFQGPGGARLRPACCSRSLC